MRRPTVFLLLSTALALDSTRPSSTLAAGFELPDNGVAAVSRGGAFSVRADDLTAIALNPGGLSRLRGTSFLYNHSLIWSDVSFSRAETVLPKGIDIGADPTATVQNDTPLFALGGMLVLASDFGLDDWAFAVGVYGPNASGGAKYPTSGGQRYMMTELDAVLLYANLAVAYGWKDTFGVGITLQYVAAPRLRLRLVVDGSPFGQLNAYYSANDVEATVELSDPFAFSAIVGAWWRPIPELEVAVSGRVIPIYLGLAGDFSLRSIENQTQFTAEQLSVTDSAARLSLVIPPTARAGLRYRYLDGDREVFDIELNAVYEAWSLVKRFKVELDGTINLFSKVEAPDAVIEKRWRDTVSVRLGGTVTVVPEYLRLSLGGFVETAAVPQNYEHLDFMSFLRGGIGAGLSSTLDPVTISVAYSHIFQEDREVEEPYGKIRQQRPIDPCPERCDGGAGWDGIPANAGKFAAAFDILALGVSVNF